MDEAVHLCTVAGCPPAAISTGNQLLFCPVLPLRHREEPRLGLMRRPHDHTLSILDLKGQPLSVAEALFIHLPRARNRLDPERVRDALASIRVETIAGPWKVDEQGLSNREGLTFQIQNGERVIVWPAHKAEARFLPMPNWKDRPKE